MKMQLSTRLPNRVLHERILAGIAELLAKIERQRQLDQHACSLEPDCHFHEGSSRGQPPGFALDKQAVKRNARNPSARTLIKLSPVAMEEPSR